MLENLPIAFIGAGAMGEAIIGGLIRQAIVQPSQILAAEVRAERRHEVQSRYDIAVCDNALDAARWGKIVLFAVKPQILPQLLPTLYGILHNDTLCISIAAGIPINTFVHELGHTVIVRAMPNTPASIGQGMTVWTASPDVPQQQHQWAQTILSSFGQALFVDNEHYLDMATAISGSGPAYIFLLLEAMIDAGVHLGFSRSIAETIVFQTVFGSVQYAMQSDKHLAQLRNAVTSPGGTTAAGLNALSHGGLNAIISDAIWAAYQRSCELGRKEKG